MPWKAQNIMSLKHEFVLLVRQEGANRRELCRRFEISPQTGYKWLQRFAREGSMAYNSARDMALPHSKLEKLGFFMYPVAEDAGGRCDSCARTTSSTRSLRKKSSPHGRSLRVTPCPPRGPLRLRPGKAGSAALA